ncbi:MAG: hypothetical protein Q4B79_00415 [Moraxella sp.]|uniref:hypothetical protein n=1 Tax=Moraxella sp. TaxID=479 RepID=UPI0026DB8441|nr:hypothetical protein [Moraxella sp.]MDO4449408.1 hypothetical protein [Moraxella sp.]
MQNFNVQIKDELVPVFMKMIAGFGQDIMIKNDTTTPKIKKRDLSKLVAHPNTINGNYDDVINVDWEKEWYNDLPK